MKPRRGLAGGDAVLMDFLLPAGRLPPALVVNLNYKKIDQEPFPTSRKRYAIWWRLNKDAEDLGSILPASFAKVPRNICLRHPDHETGLALNSQILSILYRLLELEEPLTLP